MMKLRANDCGYTLPLSMQVELDLLALKSICCDLLADPEAITLPPKAEFANAPVVTDPDRQTLAVMIPLMLGYWKIAPKTPLF